MNKLTKHSLAFSRHVVTLLSVLLLMATGAIMICLILMELSGCAPLTTTVGW